jgi:hypothetical protein
VPTLIANETAILLISYRIVVEVSTLGASQRHVRYFGCCGFSSLDTHVIYLGIKLNMLARIDNSRWKNSSTFVSNGNGIIAMWAIIWNRYLYGFIGILAGQAGITFRDPKLLSHLTDPLA